MSSGKTPLPGGLDRRKSSTLHYQAFDSPPPKGRGRGPSREYSSGQNSMSNSQQSINGDIDMPDHKSPLPIRQLAILAVISLAEQTALNSISPYLPEMTSSFPEVDAGKTGLYVGLIASSFALAQFTTNFFWGWLSDRIGRKPVIMLSTLLTAASFVGFGFSRTLWQAILAQVCMGLVNGNQGVVSSCLGEITDRSNQTRAFTYLPVIYGLGGILGPALGGLMILHENPFKKGQQNPYPYLVVNIFSASILIIDLVLTGFFLEETLEEARDLPPLKKRVSSLFAWLWQFTGGARRPTYARDRRASQRSTSTVGHNSEHQSLIPTPDFLNSEGGLDRKAIFNRDTILLLVTYLIFQLGNIAFNTLYPVYGSSAEPTGRGLNPSEIGLSLAFAGFVMIFFQVTLFGTLKEKMGNKATYRASLLLLFISMMLMPWLGHRNSKPLFGIWTGTAWLWIELGFVLLIKTIASVGGLTSALLLITNSAPNHSVLGELNGIAQTLSSAGRAAGPLLSGGLFSLSTRVRPKGELLSWGVFGAIVFFGWVASFGIRGANLESAEFDEENVSGESGYESRDENDDYNDDTEHSGVGGR